MAGTINLALTQQQDEFGNPLSGGQLYFIQAGTISTPQNAYQDTGLSIALPNPVTLDAAGRIPMFYLADGQIKVRLQDKNGVIKFQQDNLLVIGPSSGGGGGGGGSVDPTTVMSTGDMKFRYDTAIISGFVRLNGNTIGSASSGATELADPSAQALFLYLWLKDPNLAVTPGGRGASGAADWTANKQIAVPDWRGRVPAGLDSMGGAAAGRLTSFAATTLGGASAGNEMYALAKTDLPNTAPTFTGISGTVNVNSAYNGIPVNQAMYGGFSSGAGPYTIPAQGSIVGPLPSSGSFTPQGTVGSINGGVGQTSFSKTQPTMCCTFYMKL